MPATDKKANPYTSIAAAPGFIDSVGWKGLLFLNLYRIGIAIFLLSLNAGEVIHFRSEGLQQIFYLVVLGYLLLSIWQAFCSLFLQNIPYLLQVSIGMLLDVIIFAILNFAVASGDYFNILLLVSLSGASVLARGPIVWVYASMSALALLFQALQLYFLDIWEASNFIPVAIYCVICYVVVAGASWLSSHMERTENMAVSIAAHLGHINERIIDILRAGIIVLDDKDRVLFANRPAIHLLECKRQPEGVGLRQLSPQLADQVAATDKDAERGSFQFNGIDAQVVKLPKRFGIVAQKLITLEQSSIVREQAETMKNASLARLTASITHEIRNPLGAISHAAQLLREDKNLGEDSKEMASVIVRQTNRMNTIVTNITQMGRAVPVYETIKLSPWARDVATELRQMWALNENDFVVRGNNATMAKADKSQMHQALINLCENARRHSTKSPSVLLDIGDDSEMYSYIDVTDTGRGIDDKEMQHLFEPFSSDSGSLGLGLYISRELARANGGSLLLLKSNQHGSVFRLRMQKGDLNE